MLNDMRVNSLIKRFGPVIRLTYLRELWVTMHTILIHLTSMFDANLESKSLLPISRIENERQVKMEDLFEDTSKDGMLNDSLPGYLPFVGSKFDTNDLIQTS